MSASPYSNLPPDRFWRSGVAENDPETITDLYRKRFDIARTDRIATAGSCFAQHIARNLRQRGCDVMDLEPAPPGLSKADAEARGYGLYSARYANIYTARQLLQLVREAFGRETPTDRVWEKNGRFFDAQRPSTEPAGFDSPDKVLAHRAHHLAKVKQLMLRCNILVFTFGLTEAWIDRKSGTVFPTCPGTIAGTFDPNRYGFKNFTAAEVLADFVRVRQILKRHDPNKRFLITVSPVPLTATAAPMHVLQSTTYSKSVLRAVCGELYDRFDDVDYFPSYELIATPFSKGQYFEPNMRSVTKDGVDNVMRVFFNEHSNLERSSQQGPKTTKAPVAQKRKLAPLPDEEDDVVCEEAMLEAFAR
ncbi:MAG TPA: GSCFA domain-containing protein [Chthoniobacteraceae bacterium]|nr:GSCFA domain-containing protein [Chthoniobacteraceae bacterium]